MRPFPLLAAAVSAALVTLAIVDPGHWVGRHLMLAGVASLAAAFIVFSWWELWSTRHER
jgi:hypothetical protein